MNNLRLFCNTYGWQHIRSIMLFSLLSNVSILAPSFHMLQVYERVLNTGSLSTLLHLTLVVILVLMVYGLCETVRARLGQRLAALYAVETGERLIANLIGLSSASAAAKQMRNFTMLRSFLAGKSFTGLFDLAFIPFYLSLLFLLHWTIGMVTLLGIAAMIAVTIVNSRATEQLRRNASMNESDAQAFAQASYSRGEEIRAMGLLPNFIHEWSAKSAKALKSDDELNETAAFYYALGKVVRQILQVCIMAWGAFLVVSGSMSGGLIILSSIIAGKALAPIEMLISSWDLAIKSKSAFMDLEHFLGKQRELRTRPMLPIPNGFLSCENICVANPEADGEDLLSGVSLTVAPGELVVVSGPAACGKSLLARVLSGALEPSEGVVRLDEASYDQWPAAQWGGAIGYAAQEPIFFPGTIAANIAKFPLSITPEDVYLAAKKAGVHDAILHLTKGYQTVVGTGQTALSCSLTQGIALARAFYGQPKCLILDQPSAHLDQAGEDHLCLALKQAKQEGSAIVVVTRRNAIFALADRVVLIADGKVVRETIQTPHGSDEVQSVDKARQINGERLNFPSRLQVGGHRPS